MQMNLTFFSYYKYLYIMFLQLIKNKYDWNWNWSFGWIIYLIYRISFRGNYKNGIGYLQDLDPDQISEND